LIRAFIFANRDFRSAPELIIGGLVVGIVIAVGWYVSGHLGYLAEDPQTLEEKFVATNSGRLESFSFVAPAAYLLELLLLWTDQSRVVTFGIAGALGMLLGSAAMALVTRTFRWEGFASVEDTSVVALKYQTWPIERVDAASLSPPGVARERSIVSG